VYARIVFDEAHNLEKVAMRYLGVTLTYSRIRRILNRLHTKSEGSHGILAALESWVKKAIEAWPDLEAKAALIRDTEEKVHAVRSRSQEFFQRVNSSVSAASEREGDSGLDGKLRYYAESPVFKENEFEIESFRNSVGDLFKALGNLALSLASVSPGQAFRRKRKPSSTSKKSKTDLEEVVADLGFLVEAGGSQCILVRVRRGRRVLAVRADSERAARRGLSASPAACTIAWKR